MNHLDRWKNAIELNFAHFEFADPYQREKFRAASTIGAIETIRHLMVADIFARIENGELLAFGFQMEPTLSDGPVQIPTHCFMQRPKFEECEADIITASGWCYERVRVAQISNVDAMEAYQPVSTPALKAKVGRPSKYRQAAETLRALASENPRYIEQSAEGLEKSFNEKFKEMHHLKGVAVAPVSPRALRNYLKQYRQELAESGNNDSVI